jgi:hypothetical protein
MSKINDLFKQKLSVGNLGIETFKTTLVSQSTKVINIDWRPPAGGDLKLIKALELLNDPRIEKANSKAFEIINKAEPTLVGVKYAHEVVPNLDKYTIGHAGPPLKWNDMCGPLQGAVLGGIVYEGLANNLEDAEKLVKDNKIKFVSNHSIGCVGPMTGIITYSMPLWEVKNTTFGNVAYCTFNEGLGKVMRFGANGPEVIDRLKWL